MSDIDICGNAGDAQLPSPPRTPSEADVDADFAAVKAMTVPFAKRRGRLFSVMRACMSSGPLVCAYLVCDPKATDSKWYTQVIPSDYVRPTWCDAAYPMLVATVLFKYIFKSFGDPSITPQQDAIHRTKKESEAKVHRICRLCSRQGASS